MDEGPSKQDLERFGKDTHPCPNCRADVYDLAEWCHKCGHVLGDPKDETAPKPWVLVTVAILLATILFFFLF
jgi:hypothetical protein